MSPSECRKRITSHGRRRAALRASIVCSMPRVVKSRRKELPVPSGKKPRAAERRRALREKGHSQFRRRCRRRQQRESFESLPRRRRERTRWLRHWSAFALLPDRCRARRTRSRAAGARAPQRPPPAAGLTMAKKRAFTPGADLRRARGVGFTAAPRPRGQRTADLFGEFGALYFHRCGAGKIRVPDEIAADALVRQKAAVVLGELCDSFLRELFCRRFGMQDEDQLFAGHRVRGQR